MIKNTPLEYINDRINKHLENINEHKQRILRLQDDINHFNSFIKSNEIRLTELKRDGNKNGGYNYFLNISFKL